MERIDSIAPRFLITALGVTVGAGLAVVAFAGWIRYGSDIVISLSETGLSFCF
ncbi:hypothetical protein HFC70_07645 [Agrobacterium sp. a22-2]|uniref:hypothetical protein n=1 Tax=Agrobacterium sp. a22-2 TaxID=2283840 RepID=UPI001447DBAE|nr:hypothetical protein [Agrobacterium sp. a22-2]NKN36231.1 hypothetical protein [Agrobacterium sp. a22-2]